MWTNIITASRNLAQQVNLLFCSIESEILILHGAYFQFWIHVPAERAGKGSTTVLQNVIEKKTMINLVCQLFNKSNDCSFNINILISNNRFLRMLFL